MSEEEVNALISEADSNGDGVLNYEEFVKMLTSNWTNIDIHFQSDFDIIWTFFGPHTLFLSAVFLLCSQCGNFEYYKLFSLKLFKFKGAGVCRNFCEL